MIEDKAFEDVDQGALRRLGHRPRHRRSRAGKVGFEELEAYTLKNGEPEVQSGRQEMLENILNEYI